MKSQDSNVPNFVKNEKLIAWVDEIASHCQPDSVHWCDGRPEMIICVQQFERYVYTT